MNKRIRKKRSGICVEHMGYTSWQNWRNYHIMIVKGDRMVSHISCDRRMKPRELKKEIERHIYFIQNMNKFFTESKPVDVAENEAIKQLNKTLAAMHDRNRETNRETCDGKVIKFGV